MRTTKTSTYNIQPDFGVQQNRCHTTYTNLWKIAPSAITITAEFNTVTCQWQKNQRNSTFTVKQTTQGDSCFI